MRKTLLAGLLIALTASACGSAESLPTGSQTSSTAGAGGGAASACAESRASFVAAVKGSVACVKDEDCQVYLAQCLQPEIGNCAGIAYIASASRTSIEETRLTYERCTGEVCNPPSGCALGALSPVCVNGACGHE